LVSANGGVRWFRRRSSCGCSGSTEMRRPCLRCYGGVGVLWLVGREVALDVTERAHGEGQRDQGDQSPDDPGDQRDAAGALDTQPPTRAPTGMADQASTPAMLMTRPSRWWLGTICWHRLPVVGVEEDVQAGVGRSQPQRRPVPAGRGQHDRQQPGDERAPRAAANPVRSRPAGRTGFGCPRQAMQLSTPADRRTRSSRPGAPTSLRPLLRNLATARRPCPHDPGLPPS
jgi:hypothetical protein